MKKLIVTAAMLLFATSASAQDAVGTETAYIFNTLLFLLCGVLVMFMAAGFAMLEAGMVRTKNVAVILTKNISLYSVAGIMYYLVGYNLMYTGVEGGFIGTFDPLWSANDAAATGGDYIGNYAATSDWFFQMVFVATTASIVSGTLAERIKVWPFIIFVAILTAVLYPITGSWTWGAGWLSEAGFSDFAGSTIVHSVGGWAALSGALLLGSRSGRFNPDGTANPIPGSSLPQVTLGVFVLWLGWFGFNGGSQLALGSGADAIAVANIFANTNAAAAGGVVAVMLTSQILFKRLDVVMVLNGALAGLVSITAEPLAPTIGQSILIGGAGGVIMIFATLALEKARIDDVVGAIPVHLVCGIWGTLAVCFTNSEASFQTQMLGIVAMGAFTFVTTLIVWFVIKQVVGIRLHIDDENIGGDIAETGMSAYNLDFDPSNRRTK